MKTKDVFILLEFLYLSHICSTEISCLIYLQVHIFITLHFVAHIIPHLSSVCVYISVVTILEFLTSIRYLEKYRYSIPFSIPGREKNCHNIKGVNYYYFFDKYNMTMRYILHEQKCLEVVHLFKV